MPAALRDTTLLHSTKLVDKTTWVLLSRFNQRGHLWCGVFVSHFQRAYIMPSASQCGLPRYGIH